MTRIATFALALALALPAGAALASDDNVGDAVEARLTKQLEGQGYEVRKMEAEGDGLVEAYALKDGKRYELYVNPETGEIVRKTRDD